MVGRERANLAAAGVKFEPAAARSGDPFLGSEQRLRRRLSETDEDVGVGELDLAADEGQADGALVRRRRSVAGRPPGHDVGDIGLRAIKPDRFHHAVEQFSRAADERKPGYILIAPRRLADEHDSCRWIAVGEDQLCRCSAQHAALESFEERAQLVQVRRAFGGLARRHDGGLGRGRGGRSSLYSLPRKGRAGSA